MKLKCLTRFLLLPALCFLLAGCESITYYSQAILGQLSILSKREDIERLIEAESTPAPLKAKLQTILEIRQFAASELGLPVTDSFDSYVELERPFVVWNVFATPEFSMQPQRWCYPVAGCVSYRGYFNETRANRYAVSLQAQGMDVYVGGVSAYSTLGWFSDPVLSTVINREDYRLAELLFHELAHQLVYIPGDTEFNESFATAVEQEGLRRWLAANDYSEIRSRQIIEEARESSTRREQFVAMVSDTVKELEALYDSDLDAQSKRQAKAEILAAMRNTHTILRQDWGGVSAYESWMSQALNNAQLATVSTYFNWVPAFEQLLQEANHELPAFYAAVKDLQAMDGASRKSFLEARMY